MVSSHTARNIVGVIGNVISFFLFISPVPTFVKILKKRSVDQFKPDPYLAAVMNCALWIFYGLPIVHPDSTLVLTINGTGFVIECTYLTIFFIFADRRRRIKVVAILLVECAILVIAVPCILSFLHTHKDRSLVVGTLCVVFLSVMYAAPLTIMRKVIRTKSVKYMPFALSLANFLNGSIWVAYALIQFDLFILIGNTIGSILGGIQLILYACYSRSTPTDDEPGDEDFQLPSTNFQARPAPAP